MKDFSQLLFIIVFALALITACDKDDEPTETRKYPHFSSLVNGQGFSGKGAPFGCQGHTFNFYPNGFLSIPLGYMIAGGRDCNTDEAIGIRIWGLEPTYDTIYFNNPTFADSCSPYYRSSYLEDFILYDKLIDGYVKFDSFSDKEGDEYGLVSGHFEFTVKNEEIDSTVVVTNGQFQYIINYEWY